MFTEAPGPIHWHNGVYFQKEGNGEAAIALFLPDSLSLFLSFQLYLSVSLSLSFIILSLRTMLPLNSLPTYLSRVLALSHRPLIMW